MRAVWMSFSQMLKFVRQDRMLLAAGLAPFLAGAAIHFGIPFAENLLIQFTGFPAVLAPYYGLFDIFLASITPAMLCFIAAMVMLEERDDHIDRFLFVTGLGRKGYFLSRLILPALITFVVTAALLPIFRLTALSAGTILFLLLSGTLQGIIIALLIVAFSSNKLEGMAVTKLSSLMILGAAAPYFVPAPVCLCFAFLPSFWVGKAILENRLFYMLLSLLVAGAWILILQRKMNRSFFILPFPHRPSGHRLH